MRAGNPDANPSVARAGNARSTQPDGHYSVPLDG